jgi:hypothetical protein
VNLRLLDTIPTRCFLMRCVRTNCLFIFYNHSAFCALGGAQTGPGFADLVSDAECCSGAWDRVPNFVSQGAHDDDLLCATLSV